MKQMITALTIMLALLPAISQASVRVYNSSGSLIGTYTDLKLANGLAVSQVSGKAQVSLTAGDGTTALGGFLQNSTSVSGDLAASQCGYTISSDNVVGNAGGVIDAFKLPAISSALVGCRFTFIVGVPGASNQQLQVNPQDADRILLLTNSAGDAVSADNLGESLMLQAMPAGWAPIGAVQGTWTDIN